MRILQCYHFFAGGKIPFDRWPGIIEAYLRCQNLSHRVFHYYLESWDCRDLYRAVLDGTKCKTCEAPVCACDRCREEATNGFHKDTGCERASREYPFLGSVKVQKTEYASVQCLHNFSHETNDAKEGIYAIASKICRRYGFSEIEYIYRDIDFFSRREPSPAPDMQNMVNGYEGSGITLRRSVISNCSMIALVVEFGDPGEVLDATPYADALGELLPGVKRLSATQVIMEEDDRARYEEIHRRADSFVKQATAFFDRHMPKEPCHDESDTGTGVAPQLKKLGKRYGYTYSGYSNGIYCMEKQLPEGHFVCLEFVSDPRSANVDPFVTLRGLGFEHKIWVGSFNPRNPKDAWEYFARLFRVLAEAEQTVFAAILDLYPPTPDWFLTTH